MNSQNKFDIVSNYIQKLHLRVKDLGYINAFLLSNLLIGSNFLILQYFKIYYHFFLHLNL